ncbi:MAG: hypothetical protein P1U80_00640 [Pseudomonadales bacterium]|nr:hypothetical protein [Pseudomonadales bacterium]
MIGGIAVATVLQEKATQLGKSFTWSGAEVGGNADCSIPAYTGSFDMSKIPASWNFRIPYTNPFPKGKVLLTINAFNVDQHSDV